METIYGGKIKKKRYYSQLHTKKTILNDAPIYLDKITHLHNKSTDCNSSSRYTQVLHLYYQKSQIINHNLLFLHPEN